MSTTKVAVLGTGTMGRGIALSLLRAGFEVTVWNRSGARAQELAPFGATVATSPALAVTGAEVILVVTYDLVSVLDTIRAAAPSADSEAIWIQTATVGVEGAAQVADLATELGLDLVEALMMGSRPQAEAGELILIGGGARELFERVESVTAAIAKRVVHAGPRVQDGSAVKLACNSWVATAVAGTAQALAIVDAHGLDPQLWLDVIRDGTTDSPYCHAKGAKILRQDWSSQFAVVAMRKDLSLIKSAATQAGLPGALLSALDTLFAEVDTGGHGDDDIASIALAFRPDKPASIDAVPGEEHHAEL